MSTQSYARTYPDFWTSQVSDLDDVCRSLAHFLYSGQNTPPWGLYYKSARAMAVEFRRSEAVVRTALQKLETVDFVRYDDETHFVWVVEMAAWQLRPLPLKPANLLVKAARKWYANLPRNPFLGPYFDRYDADLHLSNPDVYPGSQVPRRDHERRAFSRQIPLIETPLAANTTIVGPVARLSICGEAEFETWWKAYPPDRREQKKTALEIWQKKRIPLDRLKFLLDTLEAQKRSRKWLEGYIPMPLTYLRQERWNDEGHMVTRTELNKTNTTTANTMRELIGNPDDDDARDMD